MRVENWDSKLELIIEETKNKEKFIRGKKSTKVQCVNRKIPKSTKLFKTSQNIPNCTKLYQDVQKRPKFPSLDGWSYKVDSRPSTI